MDDHSAQAPVSDGPNISKDGIPDPVLDLILAGNIAKSAELPFIRPRVFVRYVRFSTDEQDFDSVVRQRRATDRYAEKLGVVISEEFKDEGESAARADDRPALVRLRQKLKEGVVTDILIERYNRWCREGLDAAKLYEEMEAAAVNLHHSLQERVMSKADQLNDAILAELDRIERQNMMAVGHDLKVEKGHAASRPYGYKRGTRNGRPVVDPDEARVVKKIFLLIQTMSAEDVALILDADGDPPPVKKKRGSKKMPEDGDRWSASTVCDIVKRGMYAARVVNRRTTQKVNRDGTKGKRTLNTADKVAKGVNEEFRIIDDELFNAANAALKSRSKKIARPVEENTSKLVALVGHLGCDCPGVDQQTYVRFISENSVRYKCSRGKSCKGCLSLKADAIDEKLLDVLSERLGGEHDQAGDDAFDRLVTERIATQKAKAEALRRSIASENLVADRLLDSSLLEGAAPQRIKQRRLEVEGSIARNEAALAAQIETIAKMEAGETLTGVLRQRLATARAEIPFLPLTASQVNFAMYCRAALPRATIVTQGLPEARRQLHVELDAETFGKQAGHEGPEVVVKDLVIRRAPRPGSALVDPAAFASYLREFALTDRQWLLVRDHVHSKPRGVKDRHVLDAAIVTMRTGISLGRRPPELGDERAIRRRLYHLVEHGDFDVAIGILGRDDPRWLDGLDVERFAEYRRSDVARERMVGHRPEANGARRLTETQWSASLPAIDPRVGRPMTARRTEIDVRQLLDGILFCLDRGLPWTQIPARFGDPKQNRLGMMRLVYTGTWTPLLTLWSERFPSLVQGLPIERMLKVPTLGERLKERKARRLSETRAGRKAAGPKAA